MILLSTLTIRDKTNLFWKTQFHYYRMCLRRDVTEITYFTCNNNQIDLPVGYFCSSKHNGRCSIFYNSVIII